MAFYELTCKEIAANSNELRITRFAYYVAWRLFHKSLIGWPDVVLELRDGWLRAGNMVGCTFYGAIGYASDY
jgi:hypothetical protein